MEDAVAYEGKAAFVRHVQPFVPVDRHRIGAFDSLDKVSGERRDRGEQTEGPVHVQPRTVSTLELVHLSQSDEVAGVDVAHGRYLDGRLAPQPLEGGGGR